MNETTDFGKGGIVELPKPENWQYGVVAQSSPEFDWDQGFEADTGVTMPIKHQDGSSSCGGQAWSYYHQLVQAKLKGSFKESSAFYIYNLTHAPGGGSTGLANSNIVKKGVAGESIASSYDNNKPPKEPYMTKPNGVTQAMIDDASQSLKAVGYANVALNIDLFAKAVRDNYGLVMGITGKDNGTWRSKFPKPSSNWSNSWRHWMFVAKAVKINGKKFIGAYQSWGDKVGDKGIQWYGEDYFNANGIFDGWTLLFDSNFNSKHIFNEDLKFGMNTPEVKFLQERLKAEGYLVIENTTTYFGNMTKEAVIKYQLAKGITPAVGYFGKITRGKMNE